MEKKMQIYQAENGEIKLNVDMNKETVWANQKQIASIFGVNPQAITKHIKNIYKEQELQENQTCAFLEQVQNEWWKQVKRNIKFYNLDMIISVWYRINSKQATNFRIWANKIIKQFITKWFVLDKNRVAENYKDFLKVVDNIKVLTKWKNIKAEDIVDLIKSFGSTWFNLESFDTWDLPLSWFSSNDLEITAKELYQDIDKLKQDLLIKKEATDLFAQEKTNWSLEWILWNVFQSVFGEDVYSTIEEKASNLLYFLIKDHPFNDWNKRCGAFSFIRFLKKVWFDFDNKITPETLTTLTLLIATSDSKDKERMIWLTILLLKN